MKTEFIPLDYDYFDFQDNGTFVWVDGTSLHSFNFLLRNNSEVLTLENDGSGIKKIARINQGWLILKGSELLIYANEKSVSLGSAVDFIISPRRKFNDSCFPDL